MTIAPSWADILEIAFWWVIISISNSESELSEEVGGSMHVGRESSVGGRYGINGSRVDAVFITLKSLFGVLVAVAVAIAVQVALGASVIKRSQCPL